MIRLSGIKCGGISYAYYPVILYGVCIIYENIPAFCRSGYSMFKIARMADVLFVTGAVYFVVKSFGQTVSERKIFQRS